MDQSIIRMSCASELSMPVRLILFVAGHFALYYWTLYVVAPAKTSWSRFTRALVLTPLLPFVGTLFCAKRNEEFTAAAYCATMFLWLTPFKICALCMNRGQLVKAYDSGSSSAFALGLLLPVTVAFRTTRLPKQAEEDRKNHHAYKDARFSVIHFEEGKYTREALSLFASVILKYASMIALRHGRHLFDKSGHVFWRDVCFGWYFYANVSAVEDVIGLVAQLVLNVKLEPNFDRPWLAQSIKELWSHRYNVAFGTVLRNMAYDPICESNICLLSCFPQEIRLDRFIRGTKYFNEKKPTELRKSTALLVTFVVSGIMHTLLPWLLYMPNMPFLCGLFFPMNGVVILFEEMLKWILSRQKLGLKILGALPSWLCQIYAMLTMSVLGHYLFLPEGVENGYADALMDGGLAFLPSS